MSCFVQYCPRQINGRDWTQEDKDGFQKSVFDQISNYSPDFEDLVLHAEVRTPQDIENEIGITEGNIFHGELTMDQLMFNRPVPGFAQYRSPIGGLTGRCPDLHNTEARSAACTCVDQVITRVAESWARLEQMRHGRS
jgi:phytoene dehydrogenase-like protein